MRQQLTNAPGKVWAGTFLTRGQKLITWSERDNLLHEWELPTGLEEQSWQAPLSFYSVALSPDGRQCIAFGWEGEFVLRDLVDKSQRTLELDIHPGS